MRQEALLYFRMAWWFAHNAPGTPVPSWCVLAWPLSERMIEELVATYEKEEGRKITDPPA